MLQYPAKREKIAAEIASFSQAKGTAQVCAELAAILQRMRETQALAARPELSPELSAAAGASYALERQELAAIFTQICRALGTAGLTLSGGEISALKRQGMPGQLAADLDALRREKIAALPAKERLEEKTARRLCTALTSAGLISGLEETFLYYLARQSTPAAKRPEKALSWLNSKSDFAYFAVVFTELTQRGNIGRIVREKPLCQAFGFTDRERVNVIRKEIKKARNGHRPEGADQIDIIFNTL